MHTARLGRGERKRAELNRRPGAKFRLAKRDKKADGKYSKIFLTVTSYLRTLRSLKWSLISVLRLRNAIFRFLRKPYHTTRSGSTGSKKRDRPFSAGVGGR